MAQVVGTEAPASFEDAAALLREAGERGQIVRARGGGTKFDWGAPVPDPDVTVSTAGLGRIVEHNAGDLTAVLEAGVRLADAQAAFAETGQVFALDPPLGEEDGATIGGIVATADSGPLRHRYGGARDLLLGMTVALSDGSVAKSGGHVIKNVAGYDLAKLFTGSFGTLGLVLQVVVRLHPRLRATATVVSRADDPAALAEAAASLAHAPVELESLDVAWENGRGSVLARFGGAAAESRAQRAVREHVRIDSELAEDDEELWARQRAGQRSADGVVVRVSGVPAELERVLRAADRASAAVVGRAGAGVSWLRLPAGDAVAVVSGLRRELAPWPCAVLDAPADVREGIDVWGSVHEPLLRLSQRVKERFDPSATCAPGLFIGGL